MNRPIFTHFRRGDRPNAAEYNRLVDTVAGLANSLHIQGYYDSTGFHTRRFPRAPIAPPAGRSAKIQAGGVPSNNTGPFVCKLLDADGNETGDPVNVYPREHLGANDFDSTDVHPSYSAGDTMPVYKDLNNVWYTQNVFEDTLDHS